MFKKLIFSLLIVVTLFQTAIAPVQAASNWYDTGIYGWYTKVYDADNPNEIFGERYTAAQVQWVLYGLIVFPLNMMFDSGFTACVLQAATTTANIRSCFTPSSPIVLLLRKLADSLIVDESANQPQTLAQLIMRRRQISGIAYTSDLVSRITVVKPANAQEGFGFGQLSVVQDAWVKSRDISYGLLIFAAIILAFMIMMRTKISPQAVITAQSAIPKLVAAIILITFSYAIAGFMIDMLYVIIGLIATILAPNPDAVPTLYRYMVDGPMGWGLFGVMGYYAIIFSMALMVSIFGAGFSTSGVGSIVLLLSIPLIFFVVIFSLMAMVIILIFAFLRAIFMLIRAVVNIYLLVIFGPFYILGGAVTQSLGFGSWIKDLLTNLLVFPVTGVLFVFAIQFLKWGMDALTSNLPDFMVTIYNEIFTRLIGQPLTPSLNTGWSPPLLGVGWGAGFMLLLTSLALVLMVPRVADIIKGFMSGRPFAYGTAIGESVSGAARGTVAAVDLPSNARTAITSRTNWLRNTKPS